jgi:hypothetical protein
VRRSFRFRPRYRNLAFAAIGLGGLLIGVGVIAAMAAAWIGGAIGLALGVLYLRSPAWRLAVHVDDDALEVTSGGDRRFRLAWPDVVEVVASARTSTCFVDGGAPARSLLVPGPGATAPYLIEDREDLYRAIVERVAADKVREVELLEKA